MTHYLLDTNHASPLVTLSHPLRKRLLQEVRNGHTFAVCVPVVTETLFGLGLLPRAKQNLEQWTELKNLLPCYVPDERDAETAAKLQIALRRKGWQLATVDALIAVMALRYKCTLLTTDKDFQPITHLVSENWLS